MDGAKHTADTTKNSIELNYLVGRRLEGAEASVSAFVEPKSRMRIPLVVTAKHGENPCRLKGQGSSTMIFS